MPNDGIFAVPVKKIGFSAWSRQVLNEDSELITARG